MFFKLVPGRRPGAAAGPADLSLVRFETNFKTIMYSMQLNCTSPMQPRGRLGRVYNVAVNIFVCYALYNIVYSVYRHYVSQRRMETYKCLLMSLVSFLVLNYYITLTTGTEKIRKMIDHVNEDYASAKALTEKERRTMMKYIGKSRNTCELWLLLAVVTCSLFPIKTCIIMVHWYLQGQPRLVMMVDLVLPLPQSITERYEVTLYWVFSVFELFFAYHTATVLAAYEPLCPALVMHACGQLEIMKERIQALYADGNATTAEEVHRKLTGIIAHSQVVYKFIDQIAKVFTVTYEVCLKFATIGIPFSLYQIKEGKAAGNFNIEFVSFLLCCISQSFIPCYYSGTLMEKGKDVATALYGCGWERRAHVANRKTLILMLMRAQRPTAIRTIFRIVNLGTFANSVRQAYMIFNMMNLAWSD